MNFDIIVRNAFLRSSQLTSDIGITSGKIAEIAPNLRGEAKTEIDAAGRLASESFAIAHVHLDKVLTGSWVSDEGVRTYQHSAGDARKAISIASKVKEKYNVEDIADRARKVLEQAILYGATHVRAFADVDTKAELKGVKALLKLKEEFKHVINIQVAAFPQEGILSDPGADEYIRKAMELGANVVGGIPWIENSQDTQRKHVDIVFEIAKEYNKNVAMLVDDTGDPNARTLKILARKTVKETYEGRVAACHARALGVYTETYAREIVSLVAKAGIGVVTNPHTGPIHTRAAELMREGVPVALGQDDCYDAYYPYGRCNMIEVAFLASHLLRMMTEIEMNTLFDMISVNPAKIMGIDGHQLIEGGNANLVVFNAPNIQETLRNQAEARFVISQGKLVAENLATATRHY